MVLTEVMVAVTARPRGCHIARVKLPGGELFRRHEFVTESAGPGNKPPGDSLSPEAHRPVMSPPSFESVVEEHYQKLFRFAMSLVNDASLAADLTQQTFYIYAGKRGQIRDASRTKAWLFTTLHREFIAVRRKETRHPEYELSLLEEDLPVIPPEALRSLDLKLVLDALARLEERFRVPLVLYHLEELSYREIAELLEIPIGTVMSRLARGREHLFRALHPELRQRETNIIPLPAPLAAHA